jgi:uncharacterized protein (TIGR02246 family)
VRFAFFLFVLVGIPLAEAQSAPSEKSDLAVFIGQLASTRKAIADGYVRWTDATKAKDVEAVVSLYADDALVLPEGGDTVSGEGAIRAFYKGWYAGKDKLIKEQFDSSNLVTTGDLAIDTTNFSGVIGDDGKDVVFKGKRLVIWKRQMGDGWKIFRDTWNRSPM